MDGVKILISGFDSEEKDDIGKIVNDMGGVVTPFVSPDVSFVVVKNVRARKYKWALNTFKKPIVSKSWVDQCWKEKCVVSPESYRVPPFSGLTISVIGFPSDLLKKIEKLVVQNRGIFSAVFTKETTHLVCDAFERDEYTAAKKMRHSHIVNLMWLTQSVISRACLDKETFPVRRSSKSKVTESGKQVISRDSNVATDIVHSIDCLLQAMSTCKKVYEPVFTSDCSMLRNDLHMTEWTRRSYNKDDVTQPVRIEDAGIYGEENDDITQTQVVTYAIDDYGLQKVIDKANTTKSGSAK